MQIEKVKDSFIVLVFQIGQVIPQIGWRLGGWLALVDHGAERLNKQDFRDGDIVAGILPVEVLAAETGPGVADDDAVDVEHGD